MQLLRTPLIPRFFGEGPWGPMVPPLEGAPGSPLAGGKPGDSWKSPLSPYIEIQLIVRGLCSVLMVMKFEGLAMFVYSVVSQSWERAVEEIRASSMIPSK